MLPFACVGSCQRELYPRLRAGWEPSADFEIVRVQETIHLDVSPCRTSATTASPQLGASHARLVRSSDSWRGPEVGFWYTTKPWLAGRSRCPRSPYLGGSSCAGARSLGRAERRIGHSAPSTYPGISCISFRCRPGHGWFRGLTRIWPADAHDAMLEQDGNFIECLRYPQIVWRANFV